MQMNTELIWDFRVGKYFHRLLVAWHKVQCTHQPLLADVPKSHP